MKVGEKMWWRASEPSKVKLELMLVIYMGSSLAYPEDHIVVVEKTETTRRVHTNELFAFDAPISEAAC